MKEGGLEVLEAVCTSSRTPCRFVALDEIVTISAAAAGGVDVCMLVCL